MAKRKRLGLLGVLIFAMFCLQGGAARSRRLLASVSLPSLHLAPGERVAGFRFEVTSGRIAQVADLPIGWDVSVNNDPSWNTKLDASVIVGAAGLDSDYFKNFLTIEKEKNAELPFEIKGEVSVTKDFAHERSIPVRTEDFTIEQRLSQP
jgi:hypothetical protein